MLKSFLKRRVRSFGARYDYDVDYMCELIEHSASAFVKLALVQGMTHHRRGIPVAPYYAAKIRAALSEDCGPCVQLVVNMALEAGVAPTTVAAVLRGEYASLDGDSALVAEFTECAMAHDERADELRNEIRQRWGNHAIVSLGYAIASSRLYPMFKYVTGYGHACRQVRVDTEPLVPRRTVVGGAVA